jgi:hypothetical protein
MVHQFCKIPFYPIFLTICFQAYKEENKDYNNMLCKSSSIDLKLDHLFARLIYHKYGNQYEPE